MTKNGLKISQDSDASQNKRKPLPYVTERRETEKPLAEEQSVTDTFSKPSSFNVKESPYWIQIYVPDGVELHPESKLLSYQLELIDELKAMDFFHFILLLVTIFLFGISLYCFTRGFQSQVDDR